MFVLQNPLAPYAKRYLASKYALNDFSAFTPSSYACFVKAQVKPTTKNGNDNAVKIYFIITLSR